MWFLSVALALAEHALVRVATRSDGVPSPPVTVPGMPRCDVCIQYFDLMAYSAAHCCVSDGDAFYMPSKVTVHLDGKAVGIDSFEVGLQAGQLLPRDVVTYESTASRAELTAGDLMPGQKYEVLAVDADAGRVSLRAAGASPPLAADPSTHNKGNLSLTLEQEYVVGPSTLGDIASGQLKIQDPSHMITEASTTTAAWAENAGRATPGCTESNTPTCHAQSLVIFSETPPERTESAKERARTMAAEAEAEARKCACEFSSDNHCRAQQNYGSKRRCVRKCSAVHTCTKERDGSQISPGRKHAAAQELCEAVTQNPTKTTCVELWSTVDRSQVQAAPAAQGGQ